MRRRRLLHAILATSTLSAAALVTAAGPAAATGETTLTADPMKTWQTDGIVWSVAYAKGVVYVGGTFDHIRPPGAAAGTDEVARKNFAAFDAVTGEPLDCAPAFTGGSNTIRAMKASPDGDVLYIGGSFSQVKGIGRSNTAALNTSDCTLRSAWKPTVSSTVRAIDVTSDTVYIGGGFGTVQGQTRQRVAALTYSGTLLPFKATITGSSVTNDPTPSVNAITVAPELNKVIVGGRFTSVNGSWLTVHALVGLNATTGKTVNNFTGWIPSRSSVKALVNDGTNFYLGAEGSGGGVFDGRIAGKLSDGSMKWKDTCLGATQTVVPYKGVLYSGSHAHDCKNTPGGFTDIGNRQHLLGQSINDKTILAWFPDTNDGLGEKIGPRSMAMAGDILWVGGEFTTVNEKPQQGLTRFPASPDTGAPQVPILSGTSSAKGKVTLSWKASWDRDDGVLTYKIYRDGVYLTSLDQDSRYWNRPNMSYTDTVDPGSTHRYSLLVTDGTNDSGKNGPVYVTALN
ncbi:fibronectin type III domain-containing protein [Wenjunlia tyrosinilytica]|uniref:Fibronectin type-III domain-containing protein n=1 Tax=Wenjunlia tyrosinilytica TaxID=1544741 RepID=A0A917ZE15_9ACTN|nr:fibronectin type III domain-containing protein [Wenjunlia tyrosinilytica]GGO80117.1 hypothetical protein GCM10012280_01230 [Wenjunlia tyrosinilytica]